MLIKDIYNRIYMNEITKLFIKVFLAFAIGVGTGIFMTMTIIGTVL